MLDNGFKYVDELKKLYLDTWYDPKYQYFYGGSYRDPFSVSDEGDWHRREFVSINKDGDILGHISYAVDHEVNMALRFGAINFSNDKLTFGRDLMQVIDDIFCKFNMNRIEFSVIIGNPIERSYDRLVNKMGGRILCRRKQVAKTLNGTVCDDKLYEIMRTDYLEAKARREHRGT